RSRRSSRSAPAACRAPSPPAGAPRRPRRLRASAPGPAAERGAPIHPGPPPDAVVGAVRAEEVKVRGGVSGGVDAPDLLWSLHPLLASRPAGAMPGLAPPILTGRTGGPSAGRTGRAALRASTAGLNLRPSASGGTGPFIRRRAPARALRP